MKSCVIFGAAPAAGKMDWIYPLLPGEKFVIAADGGLRYTSALGLVPDVIIGDMDSYQEGDAPDGTILYPSRKDDTDMMLAVKKGLAMGFRDFQIFGGLGGRLDHTVANIQTLAYLLQFGASGALYDENHRVFLLQEGEALLSKNYHYLSVFAYSGVCKGVSITGAEYPLEDAELEPSFPLGVSNRHLEGGQMRVSVREGTLLIIETTLV